jgi:PadR family transcriptional regulator, regulatory protein PadR
VKKPEFRLTIPALKVLKLFVGNVRKQRSGADISRETGIGPGTLYPLLARFEQLGFFTSEWEEVDPATVGRPRKRLYKISGAGVKAAQEALAEMRSVSGALTWAK